jgi:hypothetical protein
MRRQTRKRWILLAQILVLAGLVGGAGWNVAGLRWGRPELPWWGLPLLAGPGFLVWGLGAAAPALLSPTGRRGQSFRLTYSAGPDWDDRRLRQALLTLTRLGGNFDLVWADDGHGPGCWILTDDEQVFSRMAADLLPGYDLEADAPLEPTGGVVVLQWQTMPPPPEEWCRQPGVDGVYFRWLSETRAIVAVWGEEAVASARHYAAREDLLPGTGAALLRPRFTGDNPWPALPRFPPSTVSAGLSAVVRLDLTAPARRLNGTGGLTLGHDPAGEPIGFTLPALGGLERLNVYGREADAVVAELAIQAIRAGLPVALLDGAGKVGARLRRRLSREIAADQTLFCDAARPAQSRFRLNPFWLPPDRAMWPAVFKHWNGWLQTLGVTPAGLGLAAYRHTRAAVTLTALLAARQKLVLDPPALWEALESPTYLPTAGERLPEAPDMLGEPLWTWWLAEGRLTAGFDAQLRLRQLRERLNVLLELAEYRVLWRGPYLDPLTALRSGQSLIWRLPDPRRRLRLYIASQLAALMTALTAWPAGAGPVLIFLHELRPDFFEESVAHLSRLPGARVVSSARQAANRPVSGALLLSRLDRAGTEWVWQRADDLTGLRAADLRRLAPGHLVWHQTGQWGALDLNHEQKTTARRP